MKILFIRIAIFFFVFFVYTESTYAQTFNWVTGGGTAQDLSGYGSEYWEQTNFMCTDPNGNVYALSVVGDLPITVDTFHATAYGAEQNILITSYTCSGQMRWAKLIASSGEDCPPLGIKADSLGNIYVAGSFGGAGGGSTFYIGHDTTISSASTEYLTIGLIQFDTSGNFKWIRYLGANTWASETSIELSNNLAIDAANNAHCFCYMKTGVPLMTGVTSIFGTYDLEYNSSGTLLSATRLQLDSSLVAYGATIDQQSNKAYVYGYRRTDLLPDSSFHCYVAAFGTDRNLIWEDTLTSPMGSQAFSGVSADEAGHLYLCGAADDYFVYMGDTIYQPSGSVGGYVSFIMKTDTAGHIEWVQQCDGNPSCGFEGLALTQDNKIVAVGGFLGLMNCDGLPNTMSSGIGTQNQPFYMVVDTSGGLIAFQQIHGDGENNQAQSVTSDNIGNIYIGGWVSDTIPDTLITSYHSVGGNTDFFILKYGVNCGCTSMPVANYTDTGAVTVGFIYNGTTTPAIDSMRWEFGDGGTSMATNPVHTYTANGTYFACVTVYTGCGSDMHCSNVIIYCATPAVATYTFTGTPPTINFTYTGTTSPVIDSIRWHFGDGGTSTATNPSHTYTATGTYTVCATVFTGCNNDTFCNTVVIPCIAPVSAAYTYSLTAPSASFTYTGTTVGIDSLRWHFGDGTSSTTTDPSHTYSTVGTYSVCVTVYNPCGSNTYCQDVSIPCITAPVASYTFIGTPTVNFTYTGTTAGIDSVRWEFGDGGTSTVTDPSYTYTATGTYSVCVTVYSACGSNTYCNNVSIPCLSGPEALFTDTGTYVIGFTYTGTTTGVDSVVWDFEDGGTSTSTNPIYTYTAVGTYTVCVTAYTACGNNTHCNTVVIPCVGEPTASFTDTGSLTIGFTYTGTTTAVDSVNWSFGDGGTSTTTNPIYNYTAAGTYSVCVTVYTACGNSTYCSNVVIPCVTPPIASFSDTGTVTIGFDYTGTAAGVDSVVWSYGDGSTDTGIFTFHTYATSDTYQVCVTAYTPCGSDSSCSEVVVIGLGVPVLSLANVQVFPNPTTDELYITGIQQQTSYRLLDVTGECMKQGVLVYGSNTLSMKTVAPGVYILEMTLRQGSGQAQGADGARVMLRVVKE